MSDSHKGEFETFLVRVYPYHFRPTELVPPLAPAQPLSPWRFSRHKPYDRLPLTHPLPLAPVYVFCSSASGGPGQECSSLVGSARNGGGQRRCRPRLGRGPGGRRWCVALRVGFSVCPPPPVAVLDYAGIVDERISTMLIVDNK